MSVELVTKIARRLHIQAELRSVPYQHDLTAPQCGKFNSQFLARPVEEYVRHADYDGTVDSLFTEVGDQLMEAGMVDYPKQYAFELSVCRNTIMLRVTVLVYRPVVAKQN